MSKITRMDRKIAGQVSDLIFAKLAELTESHGLQFEKEGGGSFDGTSLRFKLVATIDGVDTTFEDFKRVCALYGLNETHFKAQFTTHSGTYELTGLKPSRPKYPVLGRNIKTGKQFKFGEHVLKDLTGERDSEAAMRMAARGSK